MGPNSEREIHDFVTRRIFMNKEQLLVQPFDVGYTNLRFTASINAVIFGMPGHFTRRRLVMPRISLPKLDGTVCWWGRENDLKFTLLAPSPDDIVAFIVK